MPSRFTELLEEFRPVIKIMEQGKTPDNGMPHQHKRMIEYVIATMKALLDAGIRISPRRSRMLTRNLLAAYILDNEQLISETFKQILANSIPHLAWGVRIDPARVHAAHRFAWDFSCKSGKDLWLHSFLVENDLCKQIRMLYRDSPSPDMATMAVNQFLQSTQRDTAAIFSVARYAPNINEPLEVIYEMSGRGTRLPNAWFGHDVMAERLLQRPFDMSIAEGLHFWDLAYGWNHG